jgi:hypothetical protein
MNRKQLIKLFSVVIAAAVTTTADANPVTGHYAEDARCDTVPSQMLSHELGDVALFPVSEAFHYHTHRHSTTVGVPDDGIANDWTVHLENVSGQSWTNLFFVADVGATIGNADGRLEDVLGAPGVMVDAFLIDANGTNRNLLSESIADDGIFQPGEAWEFAVSNFGTGVNSRPPMLTTPGVFAGSSPLSVSDGNSSILAAPIVPEPSSLGLLIFGIVTVLTRRRRR